ncbi:MAG: sugar kinase [Pseudomonadota bacterium]
MASISVFGEPLLEVASAEAGAVFGAAQLGVAGDTLNTAVYMARLGHDVSFITALGTDTYSDAIIERLHQEGVGTAHIVRHPSRVPGLYAIRTDGQGERYFTYWRDRSAARDFFSLSDAGSAIDSTTQSDLFYFSGISFAILSPQHRHELLGVARACNEGGVKVAFDGNYRPYGWQSEDVARDNLATVGRLASIVLPTSEDDDKLFGWASPVEHAHRWRSLGAATVVVKNGPDGAWLLSDDDQPLHIAVEDIVQPIDTTGAGDSFNAGFLAALLDGQRAEQAAAVGNRLAGRVIQHRGALIPVAAMP